MMTRSTNGFTLLELVVVLAILVIVTSIATREIGQVQDQQRYQATQRGLRELEDAIFGSPTDRAPDGSLLAGGFVSDMGRTPHVVGSTELELQELWVDPGIAFDVRPATLANGVTNEDPQVLVPCGWRGPYVRLSSGATNLCDGYGNPYTNTASLLTNQVINCELKGSVEVCDGDDPAVADSADMVIVRVFGPNPDDTSKIKVYSVTNNFSSNPVTWEIPQSEGLTIGYRVVRAYFTNSPSGSATDTTSFTKSAVKDVILRAGVNYLNLTVDRR